MFSPYMHANYPKVGTHSRSI